MRTFGVECPRARFDSTIVVRRPNATVDGGRSVETSLVERRVKHLETGAVCTGSAKWVYNEKAAMLNSSMNFTGTYNSVHIHDI